MGCAFTAGTHLRRMPASTVCHHFRTPPASCLSLPPPRTSPHLPWAPVSHGVQVLICSTKQNQFHLGAGLAVTYLPTYLWLRHIVAETHSPPRERAGMCCSGAVMDNIRCCLQKLERGGSQRIVCIMKAVLVTPMLVFIVGLPSC